MKRWHIEISTTAVAKWALALANDPQSALTKAERRELRRRVREFIEP